MADEKPNDIDICDDTEGWQNWEGSVVGDHVYTRFPEQDDENPYIGLKFDVKKAWLDGKLVELGPQYESLKAWYSVWLITRNGELNQDAIHRVCKAFGMPEDVQAFMEKLYAGERLGQARLTIKRQDNGRRRCVFIDPANRPPGSAGRAMSDKVKSLLASYKKPEAPKGPPPALAGVPRTSAPQPVLTPDEIPF